MNAGFTRDFQGLCGDDGLNATRLPNKRRRTTGLAAGRVAFPVTIFPHQLRTVCRDRLLSPVPFLSGSAKRCGVSAGSGRAAAGVSRWFRKGSRQRVMVQACDEIRWLETPSN